MIVTSIDDRESSREMIILFRLLIKNGARVKTGDNVVGVAFYLADETTMD